MNILSRRSSAAGSPFRSIGAAALSAAGKGLGRALRTIGIYLMEHRKAQSSAHLYERLSRMSDVDLDRHGLRRDEIADRLRERLNRG